MTFMEAPFAVDFIICFLSPRVVQLSVDAELPSDAEILFTIPREVQIFYISVTGEVSCPSYPSALHIFRFKGKTYQIFVPKILIDCCIF